MSDDQDKTESRARNKALEAARKRAAQERLAQRGNVSGSVKSPEDKMIGRASGRPYNTK